EGHSLRNFNISSLETGSSSLSSHASMLYVLGVNLTKLSRSPAHQFSTYKSTTCSPPFSSNKYLRMAPLTIKPKYLHISPSCSKYCLLLIFFEIKWLNTKPKSSLESKVVA